MLGLAGMELTFFKTAHMVLCFGFVAKTVGNKPVLWLLVNSACTALRLSLFPFLTLTQYLNKLFNLIGLKAPTS